MTHKAHRHPDGVIDFGFYRQRAARLRQTARRAALLRWARALSRIARTIAAAVRPGRASGRRAFKRAG